MRFKIFLLKIAVAFSILMLFAGSGLLIWSGVGQYNAQIALDGQYLSWRVVADVSQWGLLGLPVFLIGLAAVIVSKISLDHWEGLYRR